MLGTQQQQIVRGPKARVLDNAQRAAAAWMLQPRLKRKHFSQAQREAARNRHVLLCFANSAIAGFEDGVQLVPMLWRRRLDFSRDGPVEKQSEEIRRRYGLAGKRTLVGVPEALDQHFLDEAAGMFVEVRRRRGQQDFEQATAPQHFEAANSP